jgi:hypothetical protein
MARNNYPIVLILLLCLAACQAQFNPVIEPTEMEIVQIQVSPASAHWMDAVAQCSDQIPNLGIYRQILPIDELDLNSADLILRLGARQEKDPFVTVVGTEEIVLVTGENVPVTSLSLESLRAIFTGVDANWDQLPEAQETTMEGSQPIRTLSYPSGHELRTLFETAFLGSEPIASNPFVHFTNETLENLLEEHPLAIGYALKSQVPESVRIINITSDNPQPGLLYVLAITPQEPTGPLRELLLCLQNAR